MADTTKFGWFGLGSMGLGMALNLQKHLSALGQPSLRYSNRTLSRGKALEDAGAASEKDIVTVLEKSTVLFTMISNDEVLEELVMQALTANITLEGKVWVDTSTVHPETVIRCSSRLAEKGVALISSPVFGASPVAASGKLIFAMAGSEAIVDSLRPFILDVMGRKIIYMGEETHKSSLLKISGNIFVIGLQELIAEGLVFAEKTGLGTQQMEQFIADMFGPVLESYSKRMTTGAWAPPLGQQPGFAITLATKDARHAISLGEQYGTKLPTLETALSRMSAAREFAGDSLDSTAVYGIARTDAALHFWSEESRQGNE